MSGKKAICAAIFLFALLVAGECQPADSRSVRRTPVVIAVEKVQASVANISTRRIRYISYYDSPFRFRDKFLQRFFDEYFGRFERPVAVETPIGSGVIIDEDGYILTNDHVVSRASNLKITLFDKSTYEGQTVSADPESDLAVIKINPGKPLKAVKLAAPGDIMLGETVIALGNPLGLQNTVTTGVVSALHRELTLTDEGESIKYKDLIQTDAAINPGNSGGPLVNLDGELVGINTCIVDSAEGIGFAISVDKVREILTELFNYRELSKIWLGLVLKDEPNRVVRVKSVERGSPAEKAGIRGGDIIIKVDNEPIDFVLAFRKYIFKRKPNDVVTIVVKRNGRSMAVPVKLAKAPRPAARDLALRKLGLGVQNLTPELARELRLVVGRGILINAVQPNSPADREGIEPGDVLIRVAGQYVYDIDMLGYFLERLHPGERVELDLVRGRFLITVTLRCR